MTVVVDDSRVHELIDENRILDLNSRNLDEAEAQSLASGIVLAVNVDEAQVQRLAEYVDVVLQPLAKVIGFV